MDDSGTVSIKELAAFVWGSDDKVDDSQSDAVNYSHNRTTKGVATASVLLDDGPPNLSGSAVGPMVDDKRDDDQDDVRGPVPAAFSMP